MKGVSYSHCGKCGKKLSAKNKKDSISGFCAKCRKSPPDGQLRFDGTVVSNPKKKKAVRRGTK